MSVSVPAQGAANLPNFSHGGRWRPGHTGAQPGDGLTAVRFDDAGLHPAVGTAGGRVALFDLRSPRPLLVKDHMYGAPIVDVKFHAPDREAGGARARRLPLGLGLGQGPPQCYEQTAPGCACAPCAPPPGNAAGSAPRGCQWSTSRLAPAERAWVCGRSCVDGDASRNLEI